MAKTHACDVEDCDRKGFKSAQALAMHKFRTHGIRKHPAKKKSTAKKKTSKKVVAAAEPAPAPLPPRLHFCPNCGYGDLSILEGAMQTMEAAAR